MARLKAKGKPMTWDKFYRKVSRDLKALGRKLNRRQGGKDER